MPATTQSPYASRYQAITGLGYDGVVRVRVGDYYGTGVLLADGKHILTAAHLYKYASQPLASTQVIFETASQNKTAVSAQRVTLHPDYDNSSTGNDLAIITLTNSAYTDAQRYTLYRSTELAGQPFTMIGYGQPGTGNYGQESSNTPTRRMADNSIDGDVSLLTQYLASVINWNPPANTQFIADFDNGNYGNDAAGRLLGRIDIGVGQQEGLITQGDSGGPAFIGNQIAGIASYTSNPFLNNIHPDVDEQNNSSYGEIAAWHSLPYYQQWVDQTIRSNYPNAPTKASEVQKQVSEGNSGTSYAYFLLQFTGVRTNPDQILSVDYTTRDGTAKAGMDYFGISDTLKLYANETQAVIAVEIIGDSNPEPDETFYLDVSNPVGGSFGVGVVTLTAMRTILNDDGVIA